MNKTFNNILISFISVFVFVCIISFQSVSAAYCSSAAIKAAKAGNYTEEFKSCACDVRSDSSDCVKQKNNYTYNSSLDSGNSAARIYSYKLQKVEGSETTTYSQKMTDLINLIKSIVNLATGVIIFLLGFGFVSNMISLGSASNNPQKRQEVIGKIGDIFATAVFIGAIPLITSVILSIVGGIGG